MSTSSSTSSSLITFGVVAFVFPLVMFGMAVALTMIPEKLNRLIDDELGVIPMQELGNDSSRGKSRQRDVSGQPVDSDDDEEDR